MISSFLNLKFPFSVPHIDKNTVSLSKFRLHSNKDRKRNQPEQWSLVVSNVNNGSQFRMHLSKLLSLYNCKNKYSYSCYSILFSLSVEIFSLRAYLKPISQSTVQEFQRETYLKNTTSCPVYCGGENKMACCPSFVNFCVSILTKHLRLFGYCDNRSIIVGLPEGMWLLVRGPSLRARGLNSGSGGAKGQGLSRNLPGISSRVAGAVCLC